jgi:acetyl-CoA C-acetyltransferase
VLGSRLAPSTPAYDLQQACGTGLQATIAVANKVALGQIEVGIAGGSDTTSDAPMAVGDALRRSLLEASRARSLQDRLLALSRIRPSHLLPSLPQNSEPRTGLSMGESAALSAAQWEIGRQEQDMLAVASHQHLAAAYERGFFDDLITPFLGVERDTNLRPNTSLEKLATLKPVFGDDEAATMTAAQTAAVDYVHGGEGLLMAPSYAMPRMLERAGLELGEFDFYEIHEAFASQVLVTLKAWEDPSFCKDKLGLDAPLGSVDRTRLNVAGSSLAAGHPFAATGGRIVATLAKLLAEKGSGRGVISICAAGGQGVTAVLER